jgi:hypothetical protein
MLTQITAATLPVETGLSIPSSPGEISPETSLEDLNTIKVSWAQNARELGHPEKVYNVAFWLGQEIVTHPREHVYKVWSSGNVYALAREYTERYQSADGTPLRVCSLAVFLGDPDRERKNLVDQIILSTKMFKVANWHWNIFGGEVKEWDDNYLIPGRWLDVFLAAEAEANEVAARATVDQMENERQCLLAELLAGHDL